jgi:ATP-dependent helicase HrpB
MAALMQGRPLLIKSAGRQEKQAREAQLGQETLSDLFLHIRAWQYAQAQSFDRPACARLGIHAAAARRTGLLFERFMKIAGRLPGDDGRVEYKQVMDETAVRKCILTGFSDRLALRRDKGTLRCDLVHGRSGELARESVVRIHPLLVASEIKEIQHGRDRKLTVLLTQATAVEESWLHELYPEDMHEERRVEYDPMLKRVVCRHRCLFRDLLLECRDSDEVHEEEAAKALADEIRLGRLSLHRWNHAVETWITRVNCLAQWCPYWDIPEITDEARCTILQQLCLGARCAKDLKHRDVWPTVHSWLTPAQRDLVERHVPERVALPCGRRAGIRYETGKAPVLSATIQDLYDLKEPPRLADGHVKLLFEILAPNRRPVQITEDLTGFWRDHYPALKRQLQRRYHKHEWR